MAYDVNKMLSDGYSIEEIGNAMGYNIDKMRKDGYSDTDITSALGNYSKPSTPREEPPVQTPVDTLTRMQQIAGTKALPGTASGSTILEAPPKEVPVEGTISALIPQNSPDMSKAFSEQVVTPVVEMVGQVVAGARTLPLGAAKALSDAGEAIGLPKDETTEKNIADLGTYIDDYNTRHPDQLIHPSTVGKLGAFMLARGKTALVGGSQLGAIEFLEQLGSNKAYGEAAQDAALTALLGGASIGVMNKLFPAEGELSREAKILLKLNQGRLSDKEAIKLLEGIPKQDQAISLAERLDLAKNYFKQAVGSDSVLATKLGRRLEQRKNIIEPFVANSEDVAQASKTFGEMKQLVDTQIPHTLETKSLVESLQPLTEYYKTDASPLGTSIKNIMLDLSEDQISAGTVLALRENINALLRKPAVKNTYKTQKVLTDIKGKLDSFRQANFPAELNTRVETEIGKYSETVNRKLLGSIIDKNTKSDFAVNWDKVLTDVQKEGLSKQVSDQVVPLLKEFSNRFHNDKYLGETITPVGAQDHLNALGVWSKVLMESLNLANTVTGGVFAKARYKDHLIVNALKKSIRQSDTPLDFVDDLVKQKVLTPEAGETVRTTANLYHGSPNLFEPNTARMSDGMFGPGFYTKPDVKDFTRLKADNPGYAKKYSNIMEIKADNLKTKDFPGVSDYLREVGKYQKANGGSVAEAKAAFNQQLVTEGYNAISSKTAGHGNTIILIDPAYIKTLNSKP